MKNFAYICVAVWQGMSLELYTEALVPYLSLALGISDKHVLTSFLRHKNLQKTSGLVTWLGGAFYQ